MVISAYYLSVISKEHQLTGDAMASYIIKDSENVQSQVKWWVFNAPYIPPRRV